MIDVGTADEIVDNLNLKLSTEKVSLEELSGRVLATPILATREQPPFDRVAMDGIAINYKELTSSKMKICAVQKAGTKALALEQKDAAIEVMTGAVLPIGTDTVVPYEVLKIENSTVQVLNPEQVVKAQNIHFKGSDYFEGDVLLKSGHQVKSTSIAIIASQGMTEAQVFKFPEIAIISSGDELVSPGEPCEPWQIWRSNSYAIRSELKSFGIPDNKIKLYHLKDNRDEVFNSLSQIMKDHEFLVISGGVSKGKFDFIQTVMEDLGVETHFYKVKQKPGKPLLFGTGKDGQVVFALPGNPVAALFCLRRFVISSLRKSLTLFKEKKYVVLEEDIKCRKDFTLFKAVEVKRGECGRLFGTPLAGNGSGDFSSLGCSTGFVEISSAQDYLKKGSVVNYFPWHGNSL